MKNHNLIYILSIFFITAACKKNNNDDYVVPEYFNNKTTTEKQAILIKEYIEIYDLTRLALEQVEQYASDDDQPIQYPSRSIQYKSEQIKWPQVITLDFGEENHQIKVKNEFLVNARGKITIKKSGPFYGKGTNTHVSFQDFYIADKKFEGELTINNSFYSKYTNNQVSWNVKITSENKWTKYIAEESRYISEGDQTTNSILDDENSNEISGKIITSENLNFQIDTKIYLHENHICKYPNTGKIEFKINDFNFILDFGDGECNSMAYIKNANEEIDLSKLNSLKLTSTYVERPLSEEALFAIQHINNEEIVNLIIEQVERCVAYEAEENNISVPATSYTDTNGNWPRTVVMDYGSTNQPIECKKFNDLQAKGIITVTKSGPYYKKGSVFTIGFRDFYFNYQKIEGSIIIEDMGALSPGTSYKWLYTINSNIKSSRSENDWFSIESTQRRYMLQGNETLHSIWDDEFMLYHSGSISTSSDIHYSFSSLIEHWNHYCKYPFNGKTEIKDYKNGIIINYNNTSCDDFKIYFKDKDGNEIEEKVAPK